MASSHPSTGDYWSASRTPGMSLIFILPFLAFYEVSLWTGSTISLAGRSGADVWIRKALLDSGMKTEWLFPLLTPLILLGWHLWDRSDRALAAGRQRAARQADSGLSPFPQGTRRHEILAGMFGESLLFAMLLVLLGQLTHAIFSAQGIPVAAMVKMHRAVSFVGAGIYEELLFRLMLLPLIYGAGRLLLLPGRFAAVVAILIGSLLFATAHYANTTAFFSPSEIIWTVNNVLREPALWYSFCFRMLAGMLFSVLFWFRGFGITAGCHVLYDLIVGVVLGGIQ